MKACALAAFAAAVVAVGAMTRVGLGPGRAEMSWVGSDYLRVLGVALAVAIVALAACLLTIQRRMFDISIACSLMAVTAVGGAIRYPTVPASGLALVVVMWFGGAAAALTVIAGVSVARQRLGRWWLGVVATGVTALFVAVADDGRAMGAFLTQSDWRPPTALARLGLLVHLLTLVVVIGWWARAARRIPGAVRDPVTWAAALWAVGAVCERVVHLSGDAIHDFRYRGSYRAWALVLGVNVPLACTLVLVVVAGWVVAVRPRFAKLPSGEIVVPDRDPLDLVRQDISAWLGDPTVALDIPDGAGGWIRAGAPVGHGGSGYDRVVTELRRDGQPVARIEHDVALAGPSPEVAAMAVLAGVALDANRLLASSLADLAAARSLAERLVQADSDMRRSLGDELAQGPVGDLWRCVEALDFGASCDEVAGELRTVTAAVRSMSHGLYPPELLHGSLRTVLPDRPGVPDSVLPGAVQVTAYLAAKHDPGCRFDLSPTHLTVTTSGPGFAQLVLDRVAVLGGTVHGATICVPLGPPGGQAEAPDPEEAR